MLSLGGLLCEEAWRLRCGRDGGIMGSPAREKHRIGMHDRCARGRREMRDTRERAGEGGLVVTPGSSLERSESLPA